MDVNTENPMSAAPTHVSLVPARQPAAGCSQAVLVLALLLVAATFFLISPPPGQTYPGAIPWADFSILRRLTDLMALGGLVASVRGVEIKDFAFQLAAVLGLALLGVRMLLTPVADSGTRRGPAAYAQILLAGWVLLSLLSSLWAGDPGIARGQALLYALSLGWAVAVANSLERRHLPALLYGVMTIAAAGGTLCVWYYYERNPAHRPGFPLGNPTTLAAAMLPGVLIAVGVLGATVVRCRREQRVTVNWPAVAAVVALVPLIWCLALTQGRGALLGLGAGLAAIGVFLVGRRLRWILSVVFAIGLVAVGLWWFSASHLDVTMARGASMRLRFYAWRYAAELWQMRPIAGHGAGSYPRLAGALAVRDRALDPGAFMGEIVEHAHNELFEVLTEIGLVGGVTYVGGLVATIFAASALLRATRPGPQRWLVLGLVGSVAALLADAMTGVALRLPGVGAILFTLLGALWAVSGPAQGFRGGERGTPGFLLRSLAAGIPAATVCLAAAGGAGWLALRNLNGVRIEQAARVADREECYGVALQDILAAEPRLLDPVRVVDARRLALGCRLALAGQAFNAWRSQPATVPSTSTWRAAVRLAQEAYTEAGHLGLMLPSLTHTDAVAARAAEMLAALYASSEPAAARDWGVRVERGWRRQRQRTPYNVEALLALTSYSATLEVHVGLLRDALREGEPLGVWLAALARLGQVPSFQDTLGHFIAAAGPFSPQTDLDSLIASMAPETERLVAAWLGLRGDYAGAAQRAARAAALYGPLRARFPELYPRALAEEATYLLRASVDNAPRSAELLRQAIAALPKIQAQKYEAMTRPFRERLVLCLLAMGREDEAREVLRASAGEDEALRAALADAYVGLATSFIRQPLERRPPMARDWLLAALRQSPRHLSAWSWLAWLDAQRGDAATVRRVLQDAAAAGVAADGVALIRRSLCQEFPALCEAIGGTR